MAVALVHTEVRQATVACLHLDTVVRARTRLRRGYLARGDSRSSGWFGRDGARHDRGGNESGPKKQPRDEGSGKHVTVLAGCGRHLKNMPRRGIVRKTLFKRNLRHKTQPIAGGLRILNQLWCIGRTLR